MEYGMVWVWPIYLYLWKRESQLLSHIHENIHSQEGQSSSCDFQTYPQVEMNPIHINLRGLHACMRLHTSPSSQSNELETEVLWLLVKRNLISHPIVNIRDCFRRLLISAEDGTLSSVNSRSLMASYCALREPTCKDS